MDRWRRQHATSHRRALAQTYGGLEITHIPYSSAAPAMLAVAAGQVPIGLTAMPPTVPLIKSARYAGSR